MKVLILIAHADTEGNSHVHPFAFATRDALLEDGHEVKVIELTAAGFDKTATKDDFLKIQHPENFHYANEQNEENLIPLIREHQKLVEWCTHMLIFGPMWYFRFPATFYAYFERVFTCGFGYTATKFVETGPMRGKKAMCVFTCGNSPAFVDPEKGLGGLEALVYHTTSGHLRYCGFDVLRSQAFCHVEASDYKEKVLPELLAKWKLAMKNLEHRPLIPFYPFGTAQKDGMNEIQYLASLPQLTLDEAIKL